MMKTNLMVIIAFFACLQLNAQNTIESEEFKISFETPEPLDKYETELVSVLGYDNDNYSVDIEIFSLDEQPGKIYSDLKYRARKIAEYMEFENIIDGGTVPNVKSAFYVVTEEKVEDISIPVYVIVMLNNDLQIAYEIAIYCYNMNTNGGETIVKSFKLLN